MKKKNMIYTWCTFILVQKNGNLPNFTNNQLWNKNDIFMWKKINSDITFFSWTLKDEETKVSLEFWFSLNRHDFIYHMIFIFV